MAERRYGYSGIPYVHRDFLQQNFVAFRSSCRKNGCTADPEQLGWL